LKGTLRGEGVKREKEREGGKGKEKEQKGEKKHALT